MSLLEVDHIDQFYGDFQALFDVSVEVDEGEIVAMIGANGAGKSTLLNAIAGLRTAPPNTIRFGGDPVGDLPAYDRASAGIILVPEGRRVFPSLSVMENLRIGAHAKRRGPWTMRRVLDLFPLLEPIADRPASVLSGGEQQAVAIGRALMANPRLLLMDEISLGLAPVVVKQLYRAVPSIAREGTTLVLVEQDVTQALRIAGRVYCLLEGRVSLEGRPADLPHEAITSAYFGI